MENRITDLLGQDELLAMLAEECTELAQAALKLRRAMTGINPTPVPVYDAERDLNEEAADVLLCLDQIGCVRTAELRGTARRKKERWIRRLTEVKK